MTDLPVTRENTEHFPDATLEDDVNSIGALGAHVTILSKRRAPEGYAEFQLRQALDDALAELGPDRVNQIIQEAAE